MKEIVLLHMTGINKQTQPFTGAAHVTVVNMATTDVGFNNEA